MPIKRNSPKIHLGTAWPFAWGQGWGLKRFSIDLASFTTHMYIVGRSGKGKSKFLEGFLWQLIQHGQGCGLIDPHGDLADNLLKLLAFQPLDKSGRTWLSDPPMPLDWSTSSRDIKHTSPP
jgi:DNA helicase HerA-like ATPase